MANSEVISVLIFLAVIICVYVCEASMLAAAVAAKLHRKKASEILFTPLATILHFLAVGGVICFLYGFFVEPYWVRVKTVNIYTDKLKTTSLKIVQISDIHCDKKPLNELKLAAIINPLKPDIIVFTGDCLNIPQALPRFKETMKGLKATIGKYAVSGNVDYVMPWPPAVLFKGTDFEVLNDRTVTLEKNGETFYLSGLIALHSSLKNCKQLALVPADKFSVLLHHYPDLVEEIPFFNVDLYLAAHTHGGQIAVPGCGALVTLSKYGRKYVSGLYKIGENTVMYVNPGLGLAGGYAPRARFFARPEITVFVIKPATLASGPKKH